MTRFMNVLASFALATALTPIAANATTMPSWDVGIAAHEAISAPLPEVQHVVACNAAVARQTANNVVVTSGGWRNQRYPESFGG
jgi:hypothetical protein